MYTNYLWGRVRAVENNVELREPRKKHFMRKRAQHDGGGGRESNASGKYNLGCVSEEGYES